MKHLAITAALILAGCGGDDGGPIPLDQYPGRLAEAACAGTFRCCDATERAWATEAECRYELAAFYAEEVDELRPALVAGRLAYDPAGAAACLDALAVAACTATREVADACVVFVGQVARGGTCVDRDECTSGDFCDQQACVAAPGVGDECVGEECGEGAYCYTRAPTDPPGPLYTCRAPEADGARCTGDHQCASGACDPETSTCGPPRPSTRCDGV